MAKQPLISSKRLAIDRANTQVVAIAAVAAFISVFSLVAAHSVFVQNQYQSRVITAKNLANNQLLVNLKSVAQLEAAYTAFTTTSTNVIGGQTNGTGQNDGNNAKIILDALPSSYDFPALTSSIEKLLTGQNVTITSITGVDDQLNQQTNVSSAKPTPVPIPFAFSVSNATYQSIQQLVTTLQDSIRPISIDQLTLSGGANNMTLTVNAHTYYQPAKNLQITKAAVK
jgi:hypothetical protein